MKKILIIILIVASMVFATLGCGESQTRSEITGQALNQIKFRELVKVQGGTYKQSSINEDDPSFMHTISTFRIGKYEVTYELWYTVKEWAISKGYKFENAGREGNDGVDGAAITARKHEPVTMIYWRDVIVWCNAYSEMENLSPVYTYSGKILKDSNDSNADNPECNWTANGYRLPTEGEWQFSASGRGNTPYKYASGATADYNNEEATKAVSIYEKNSGNKTANVGTKKPNALGIYDMSGNVWELCWDWYGNYSNATKDNFRGQASGSYRVKRGGSWNDLSSILQVGWRNENPLVTREQGNVGLRISRSN